MTRIFLIEVMGCAADDVENWVLKTSTVHGVKGLLFVYMEIRGPTPSASKVKTEHL